jgi:glutathione peroxidase
MGHLQYFLASLNFLDWWELAVILALTDVFLPRARLLPPAVAAGILGFVLMLYPQIGWQWQLPVFVLLALAFGLAYRWKHGRQAPRSTQMTNFHDFSLKMIDGRSMPTQNYEGSVVLVVNVASECGLTPQYTGLENLYKHYKDRGLVVLGLPCNQFGAQEPGSEAKIKEFCEVKYGVDFPLTSKIEVNGPGAHPLYAWLRSQSGGTDIQWNFEKFLIGKDGKVIKRYSPKTVPEDAGLKADIQAAL